MSGSARRGSRSWIAASSISALARAQHGPAGLQEQIGVARVAGIDRRGAHVCDNSHYQLPRNEPLFCFVF
jgi:hypothetical protein